MTIKVYNELLGINHVLAGKIKTFELKSMFCNIFFCESSNKIYGDQAKKEPFHINLNIGILFQRYVYFWKTISERKSYTYLDKQVVQLLAIYWIKTQTNPRIEYWHSKMQWRTGHLN